MSGWTLPVLTLAMALPVGLVLARASVALPGGAARPGRQRILLLMLAALLLALWAALAVPGPRGVIGALLGWQLLLLAVLDGEHFWLPRPLTILLLLSGLGATAAESPGLLPAHLLGAAIGFAALAVIAFAYRRWRGQDGLGGGDAWLLAGGGAWTGWYGLPSILVLGSLMGLLIAALPAARGKPVGGAQQIPFGVGLAVGIWLVWLYGPLDQLL